MCRLSDSQVGKQQVRGRRAHPPVGRDFDQRQCWHACCWLRRAGVVAEVHDRYRCRATGRCVTCLSAARLAGARRTSERLTADRDDHCQYHRCKYDRRYPGHCAHGAQDNRAPRTDQTLGRVHQINMRARLAACLAALGATPRWRLRSRGARVVAPRRQRSGHARGARVRGARQALRPSRHAPSHRCCCQHTHSRRRYL